MDDYTRYVATMLLLKSACGRAKIKEGSAEQRKLLTNTFTASGWDSEKVNELNTRYLKDVEQIQRVADLVCGITRTRVDYILIDSRKEWLP